MNRMKLEENWLICNNVKLNIGAKNIHVVPMFVSGFWSDLDFVCQQVKCIHLEVKFQFGLSEYVISWFFFNSCSKLSLQKS